MSIEKVDPFDTSVGPDMYTAVTGGAHGSFGEGDGVGETDATGVALGIGEGPLVPAMQTVPSLHC